MGKEYSTPVVEFEAYNLTNQIAGACADAGKTPVGDAEPISITNAKIHCINENGEVQPCSSKSHTWTANLNGTIFADGNTENGCTYDVYTQKQYTDLLISSLSEGSTVSGDFCKEHGTHFIFKGQSHQHMASFPNADFTNYFQS